MKNKLYIQDLILKESNLILSLLYNQDLNVCICRSDNIAHYVENKLIRILYNGNINYLAIPIDQAMKKIIILKYRNRFISKIYEIKLNKEDIISFG